MRFEAKKKALASAAKTVKTITDALASSGQAAEALHLIASGKVLKLRTVAGGQVVERVLKDDVIVSEEGSAPVDPVSLSNALGVNGDTFKVQREGQYLNFACGKAKGRLEVKQVSEDTHDDTVSSAPKATISAPGFRLMLKAITLKQQGKAGDRTLHIDAKSKTMRGEATDQFRGVTVTSPFGADAKLPGSASLSLPSKALDTIGFLLEDASLIGFDEKFFSIKSPGLFISIPQAATPSLDIKAQLDDILGSATPRASFVVSIKEVKDAISDALAISTDKSGARLTVALGPSGGQMLGEGDAGAVEADFAIVEAKSSATVKAQVVPSYLRECLDFYEVSPNVLVHLYDQLILLDLPDQDALLTRQTTVVPLLATLTVEKASTKGSAAEGKKKPVEEDDEPAAPKKAKAPVQDDEDDEAEPVKPSQKKKKAPEPESAEDDDEPEAPPAKKPKAPPPEPKADEEDDEPPVKKPPAKPKATPVVQDDEEDDDEEDFDD